MTKTFEDLTKYGRKEFKQFEFIGEDLIISHKLIISKQCKHVRVESHPNCTADDICLDCGKTLLRVSAYVW